MLLHRSPTWSYYNLPRLAKKRRVYLSRTTPPLLLHLRIRIDRIHEYIILIPS